MKAVIQRDTNGIKALDFGEIEVEKFLPTSILIKTSMVPLLPYDVMKLNGKIPVTLPHVLGYGAVGRVEKVGKFRSEKLINQRVLVLNPSGTFKERITSHIPPLTISIPDAVTDSQAVSVVDGLDTAFVLYKKIIKSSHQIIVITGANSVIGLALLQLLKSSDKTIVPLIREKSANYFQKRCKDYQLPVYSGDENLKLEATLVVDIAGQEILLKSYIERGVDIISIAQQNILGVRFISEGIFPGEYAKLLELLKNGDIILPIDREFYYHEIKEAINYQENFPSRGRNLISFV